MTPFVSVIVPVRNGASHIEGCLLSLARQQYPLNAFEILIVDGASDDDTPEKVRAFLHSWSGSLPQIRILNNPQKHRGPAMNVGIRESVGEIILRVDVRNEVGDLHIAQSVEALKRTGARNVGGVIEPLWKTLTQRAVGIAMSHPCGIGNTPFRRGKGGFCNSAYLGCYPREIFDTIGLFDETSPLISEETDLNQRIKAAGGTIYTDATIRIGYYPRESFSALWRLYHRYGGARAMLFLKHGTLTSPRQFLPLAFIISSVVLLVASIWFPTARIFLAIEIGAYGAFVGIGALHAGLKHSCVSLLPRIATAMAIMHSAWALGFFRVLILNGLFKRNINIEA
jgi:succinoglycan biosynthesis protein ExoA